MTASQIQRAIESGFQGIRLNSVNLIDPQTAESERQRAVKETLEGLQDGRSVILYSTFGPDDQVIDRTKEQMKTLGIPTQSVGHYLGAQQGMILKDIVLQTGLRRVAIAGGDTAGNVLKQLGIYVLEFLVPLGTATPLCRARSHINEFDGLEIALKGGQLGELDFFGNVLQGTQRSDINLNG